MTNECNDIVDYCFLKDNKYIFIKILTKLNNNIYSLGNKNVTCYKKYISFLTKSLNQKDITTNFTFDVICIEFIKDKKPTMVTLHNEKFIHV